MARRRKQRNPLLMRILGVSIAAHLIALPILAHFGAFKKVQQDLMKVTLMKLPPPKPATPPPPKQKAVKKAKKAASHAKKAARSAHNHAVHQKPNPFQPKVIAGKGTGSGGGGGATVDNSGSGVAGKLPVAPPTQPAKPVAPIKQVTPTPPAPKPAPPVKKPPVQIAQAPKSPVAPLLPPTPVVVPAQPAMSASSEPQPEIPDDLRIEALDKTCIVEVQVDSQGVPKSDSILQSSGISRLDRRALEAARKWKFTPGTVNGIPTASVVRLHIQFEVN